MAKGVVLVNIKIHALQLFFWVRKVVAVPLKLWSVHGVDVKKKKERTVSFESLCGTSLSVCLKHSGLPCRY